MLHLDVKKLGRIPEGGGKRLAPGFAETRSGPHPQRSLGLEYLHVAVDDHSRYAHVAALPDERGATCAAFLEQALAVFSQPGVRVRRVLTDNAKAWCATAARLRLQPRPGSCGQRCTPTRPAGSGCSARVCRSSVER